MANVRLKSLLEQVSLVQQIAAVAEIEALEYIEHIKIGMVERIATRPAATAGRELPGWAPGAVFYEVFVRSFQDSNGDGKGDLDGLIARLDYLNDGNPATDTDLGVDALWLMPVFASPSYHGYDTTHYETINPDYGTNADFARLLAEAHRRGIQVIVDLVINHTSAKHPWFVESASSPSAARCVPLRSNVLDAPSTNLSARDSVIGASSSASGLEVGA